ncbi:hypothetical protein AFK69_02910 [Xenorhabdus sp. GDc328]|nr:hypothetical protein AAY47_16780 [Xenorhabdus griffiniae]KOP34746.1 hypothetical protein AFK69_02910 [Xenorhabdus sp. GDc328]
MIIYIKICLTFLHGKEIIPNEIRLFSIIQLTANIPVYGSHNMTDLVIYLSYYDFLIREITVIHRRTE